MTTDHGRWMLHGARGRRWLPYFVPLSVEEFKARSQNIDLQELESETLTNVWIRPVSRFLQMYFQIDPRHFERVQGTGEEDADGIGEDFASFQALTRDFKEATAIMIDKVALNEEDVKGEESEGGSSRAWDHQIPNRIVAILEPYAFRGGRITRA